SGPAHGTLTLNPDGGFSYTPAANYNGPDSFTYRANDGTADSNVATVAMTVTAVNDAPVAAANRYTTNQGTTLTVTEPGAPGNDSYAVDEDTTLTINTPGVLANDADIDSGALSAILVTGPAHGVLILHADGGFSYTPAANYNGLDSFTYKANDGTADSNTATV